MKYFIHFAIFLTVTAISVAGSTCPASQPKDETALVQLEHSWAKALVTDPSGKPIAQVRFTDIFIYHNGRWQALAGHETLLTSESK